jgi:hypothetical protein
MAKSAAPYLHPRRISIQAPSEDRNAKLLTDEELEALIYIKKRMAGIEKNPRKAGWFSNDSDKPEKSNVQKAYKH